ncbi:hypothetical protein TRFO_02677 [Tritrichomonas foetus]|uniref:Uncharacterized protein n=1 Tax=Tritrichomonas foetus TaxID=1144522 RepID=A0A1J4L3D1_9EUKA|nr:hypothetical protein TRFO_02677 [Tritrichomonas foetus]|eukprot:OHT16421.1 hypothetical protein TRFO_02677 [Tritrichomonas foetus]
MTEKQAIYFGKDIDTDNKSDIFKIMDGVYYGPSSFFLGQEINDFQDPNICCKIIKDVNSTIYEDLKIDFLLNEVISSQKEIPLNFKNVDKTNLEEIEDDSVPLLCLFYSSQDWYIKDQKLELQLITFYVKYFYSILIKDNSSNGQKNQSKVCEEFWHYYFNWFFQNIDSSMLYSYFLFHHLKPKNNATLELLKCFYIYDRKTVNEKTAEINHKSRNENNTPSFHYFLHKSNEKELKLPALYFSPYFLNLVPDHYETLITNTYSQINVPKIINQNIRASIKNALLFILHYSIAPQCTGNITDTEIKHILIQKRMESSPFVSDFQRMAFLRSWKFTEAKPNNYIFSNVPLRQFLMNHEKKDDYNKDDDQYVSVIEKNQTFSEIYLPFKVGFKTAKDIYNFNARNIFLTHPIKFNDNQAYNPNLKNEQNKFSNNIKKIFETIKIPYSKINKEPSNLFIQNYCGNPNNHKSKEEVNSIISNGPLNFLQIVCSYFFACEIDKDSNPIERFYQLLERPFIPYLSDFEGYDYIFLSMCRFIEMSLKTLIEKLSSNGKNPPNEFFNYDSIVDKIYDQVQNSSIKIKSQKKIEKRNILSLLSISLDYTLKNHFKIDYKQQISGFLLPHSFFTFIYLSSIDVPKINFITPLVNYLSSLSVPQINLLLNVFIYHRTPIISIGNNLPHEILIWAKPSSSILHAYSSLKVIQKMSESGKEPQKKGNGRHKSKITENENEKELCNFFLDIQQEESDS